jgi:isoleucyl-tRNA synthetase
VLETTTRLVAPLLPLTAEEIWRGLTGGRSVHLTDWPAVDQLSVDDDLVAAMDRVREVCSTGSALRKAENLRVRLPLSRLTVVAEDSASLRPYAALIADELNVRDVVLTDLEAAGADAFGVRQVLQVNARAAGPRLGKDVQTAIKASKSGEWAVAADGSLTAGGIALLDGEYSLQTVVADASPDDHRAAAMLAGGGFVILDTEVTPELAAEGLARDVVRAVQQARREAGLQVSDRIDLTLGADQTVRAAVEAHTKLIKTETLAATLDITDAQALPGPLVSVGDKQSVRVALTVADPQPGL